MDDLISRKELLQEIKSLRVTITGIRGGKNILSQYMTYYRESVQRIIEEQPTVDAVPVVHGEWKHRAEYNDFLHCECSNCGFTTENYRAIKTYGKSDTDYTSYSWHFCPKCGAKMDGKKVGA